MMSQQQTLNIAILGGAGDLGTGLSKAWLAAGHRVIIGSRSRETALKAARELGPGASGEENLIAAQMADVIVVAVPYSGHDAILREIRHAAVGKIVIDAVVPLVPPKVSTVQLPKDGSAAQIAQAILGPQVKVASAFHNVGAAKLKQGHRADCDVLVFADDRETRETAMRLAECVGARAVDAGPLANSAAAEALTSVLIGINRRYKIPGAGIKITGLDVKRSS